VIDFLLFHLLLMFYFLQAVCLQYLFIRYFSVHNFFKWRSAYTLFQIKEMCTNLPLESSLSFYLFYVFYNHIAHLLKHKAVKNYLMLRCKMVVVLTFL